MWFSDNLKTDNVVFTLCRILLGAVFVYASWEKILDPEAFSRIIANYQIVPSRVGHLAALFLPWLELVCGICLLVNRWTQGAALVVAFLMLIFMVALGYSIIRGLDISCGCFTLSQKAPANMWGYLIRDSLLLTIAVGVMRYRYPNSYSRIPA